MDRKTPGFREVHRDMEKGRSRKISRWDWILWSVIAVAIVTLTVLMVWFGLWEPVSTIAVDIWDLLGWGIVIIAAVLLTLVGLGWGHRLSLLVRYWNQSIGGLGILMGGWGILALFDMGGNFGLDMIGRSEAIAYLRIIGIFFVSIIIIAPEVGYFVFVKPVRWLIRRSPRPKAPSLTRRSRQPVNDFKPAVLDEDTVTEDKTVTPTTRVQPKTTVVPVPTDHQPQRGPGQHGW